MISSKILTVSNMDFIGALLTGFLAYQDDCCRVYFLPVLLTSLFLLLLISEYEIWRWLLDSKVIIFRVFSVLWYSFAVQRPLATIIFKRYKSERYLHVFFAFIIVVILIFLVIASFLIKECLAIRLRLYLSEVWMLCIWLGLFTRVMRGWNSTSCPVTKCAFYLMVVGQGLV